ncbi:MAG TPA: M48 family metallopeptidase [Bacteroidia bacterium]|nr:M48 family metallopeptidase [Bacteroidia bacterium]
MILTNWRNISKLSAACLLLMAMSCGQEGNGANEGKKEDAKADAILLCDPETYDLECMKDGNTSTSDEMIELLGSLKKGIVDAAGGEVPDERQDEYGDQSRKEIEREFRILKDHPKTALLNGLMRKLLQLRAEPSMIGYNIYVIESDMVNAFTLGGEIYVTNTLLQNAGSTDELACIIGHEIGHNELGHVADKLKEVELAQGILGNEAGAAFAGFVGLVTMGFNQVNEAQADLYGIDLALAGGYDACRGIDFWDRMQDLEGEENDFENFFRSHPYSARRAKCYRSHLSSLHKLTCEN